MQTELRFAGIATCAICRDQLYDFAWVSVVQALVAFAFGLGGLFFLVEEILLFAVLVFVKHRITATVGAGRASRAAMTMGSTRVDAPHH